jgi:hypothetical protein
MAQQEVVLQALEIGNQGQFGPIKIGLPQRWPGMQMTLNQITLSKKGRHTVPIIGLARADSKKRLDKEPEAQQFILVEGEDQLVTGNKLLALVLPNELKHGNRLVYSQLVAFDQELNGQMRSKNAAFADAVDMLAPAIEIDAAHFKGIDPLQTRKIFVGACTTVSTDASSWLNVSTSVLCRDKMFSKLRLLTDASGPCPV